MDFPKNPRIAIVGTGAIGGYYGALLARSGCEVHFLMQSDLAVDARKAPSNSPNSPKLSLRKPPLG